MKRAGKGRKERVRKYMWQESRRGAGREEARVKMGAHGFHVGSGDSNSGPALQVFSLPTERLPSTCMIN